MAFCLIATVLVTHLIVLWYFLGYSWAFIGTFGSIGGALLGLFIFWSYTELTLLVQNLSKIDVGGKSVLITGCDCGFGLMLAESLVKRGMFVFAGVLSLDSTGAKNLKPLSSVKVIKMDVTVDEDVKNALGVVKQHLASNNKVLWAVVNNAGIFHFRMIEFTRIEDFRKVLDVNTFGLLRVSQTFAPLLRGRGRIVNIVSTLGQFVNPLLGAYCASKFAADAVSKALRIEMYAVRLPVITINPYGYKTALFENNGKGYGDEDLQVYGEKFFLQCMKELEYPMTNLNENTHEVIHSLESAILNKKFQYNYIPNFRVRLLVNFMKCFSDEYLVRHGCPYFWAKIPTSLD